MANIGDFWKAQNPDSIPDTNSSGSVGDGGYINPKDKKELEKLRASQQAKLDDKAKRIREKSEKKKKGKELDKASKVTATKKDTKKPKTIKPASSKTPPSEKAHPKKKLEELKKSVLSVLEQEFQGLPSGEEPDFNKLKERLKKEGLLGSRDLEFLRKNISKSKLGFSGGKLFQGHALRFFLNEYKKAKGGGGSGAMRTASRKAKDESKQKFAFRTSKYQASVVAQDDAYSGSIQWDNDKLIIPGRRRTTGSPKVEADRPVSPEEHQYRLRKKWDSMKGIVTTFVDQWKRDYPDARESDMISDLVHQKVLAPQVLLLESDIQELLDHPDFQDEFKDVQDASIDDQRERIFGVLVESVVPDYRAKAAALPSIQERFDNATTLGEKMAVLEDAAIEKEIFRDSRTKSYEELAGTLSKSLHEHVPRETLSEFLESIDRDAHETNDAVNQEEAQKKTELANVLAGVLAEAQKRETSQKGKSAGGQAEVSNILSGLLENAQKREAEDSPEPTFAEQFAAADDQQKIALLAGADKNDPEVRAVVIPFFQTQMAVLKKNQDAFKAELAQAQAREREALEDVALRFPEDIQDIIKDTLSGQSADGFICQGARVELGWHDTTEHTYSFTISADVGRGLGSMQKVKHVLSLSLREDGSLRTLPKKINIEGGEHEHVGAFASRFPFNSNGAPWEIGGFLTSKLAQKYDRNPEGITFAFEGNDLVMKARSVATTEEVVVEKGGDKKEEPADSQTEPLITLAQTVLGPSEEPEATPQTGQSLGTLGDWTLGGEPEKADTLETSQVESQENLNDIEKDLKEIVAELASTEGDDGYSFENVRIEVEDKNAQSMIQTFLVHAQVETAGDNREQITVPFYLRIKGGEVSHLVHGHVQQDERVEALSTRIAGQRSFGKDNRLIFDKLLEKHHTTKQDTMLIIENGHLVMKPRGGDNKPEQAQPETNLESKEYTPEDIVLGCGYGLGGFNLYKERGLETSIVTNETWTDERHHYKEKDLMAAKEENRPLDVKEKQLSTGQKVLSVYLPSYDVPRSLAVSMVFINIAIPQGHDIEQVKKIFIPKLVDEYYKKENLYRTFDKTGDLFMKELREFVPAAKVLAAETFNELAKDTGEGEESALDPLTSTLGEIISAEDIPGREKAGPAAPESQEVFEETITPKELESTIEDLVSRQDKVEIRNMNVSLEGKGKTISLVTQLEAKKGTWISIGLKGDFVSVSGALSLENTEIDASWMVKSLVQAAIEPQLENIVPNMRTFFAEKYHKKPEDIELDIVDGNLVIRDRT